MSSELSRDLIDKATEIFQSEEVYSAPIDLHRPEPRPKRFVANDLGAAAVEAMSEIGITTHNRHLRQQLEHGLMRRIPDWREITDVRQEIAGKLNRRVH